MKKDQRRYLKIKLKSLAAESKIIRAEEAKTYGDVKWDLQQHRKGVVRPVTRTNHLAYGFLNRTPYEKMERKCHEAPDLDAVWKVVKRFAPVVTGFISGEMTFGEYKQAKEDAAKELETSFKAWREEAEEHLEGSVKAAA